MHSDVIRHISQLRCIIIISGGWDMKVIYIDVLLVLNIYVDYLLLKTTARFTRTPLPTGRCLTASILGSFFSLMIFAPELPPLIVCLTRLTAAVIITAVSFGIRPFSRLLLNTGVFFMVNFIFAGAVYAVIHMLRPQIIFMENLVVYADISLIVLVLTTGGLYLVIKGAGMLTDSSPEMKDCYMVCVKYKGETMRLHGFPDTGNVLIDHFSGRPVIICGEKELGIKISGLDELPEGFRLIPFSTVSECGIMPVFRPENVTIENILSGKNKAVDAMIGVGKNPDAVFNPRLLRL